MILRENFYKAELFLEHLAVQKNLTENTRKSYFFDIKNFLNFFKDLSF